MGIDIINTERRLEYQRAALANTSETLAYLKKVDATPQAIALITARHKRQEKACKATQQLLDALRTPKPTK